MLVLLLEHETPLGNRLFDALRHADLSLYWVTSAREAHEALFQENFDLVVADLCHLEGSARRVDFLCSLRRASPASRFVAISDQARDVEALDGCAEAIVSRPVVLEALVQGMAAAASSEPGTPGRHAVLVGDLYINFAFQVVERDGVEIPLTNKELALLRVLASPPGVTVSRNSLLERVYDGDAQLGSNSLEVHIHHLRKKLGRDRIRTLRGRGYCLDPGA